MAEHRNATRLAGTEKGAPSAGSFARNCLRGRVALITGGGSGIGLKIAEVFMQYGADVAILSRNESKLVKAAQALEGLTGRKCIPVRADVRSNKEVVSAVKTVTSALGCIDILVNAAAGNFLCPASRLSANAFKTVLEIDAVGSFIVSRAVYDAYRKALLGAESGSAGQGEGIRGLCILNVSMTLHYVGALLQAHAGAAKAAVDALTKHLAVEWGPAGVRVCGVAPGPVADTEGFRRINPNAAAKVASPSSRQRLQMDDLKHETPSPSNEALHAIREFIPLQRLGAREDVAFACLFLCLPEARPLSALCLSFITGTTLVVDGGQWLTAGNATALDKTTRDCWREAFASKAKL